MADNNIEYEPAPVPDYDPEAEAVLAAQAEADAVVAEQNQIVDDQDPFEAARLRAEEEYNNQIPENFGTPEDLGVDPATDEEIAAYDRQTEINRNILRSEDQAEAAQQAATLKKAQDQATYQARYKQPGNQDWRVRLVLAEGANYLYKDKESVDVLKPLQNSNGVIFPYTPRISTSYSANYDKYDLVHSNYRGYFYKNSAVNDINITATFTAQDTNEAQYLLAVIHFFRSVTKMFYGSKDSLRGSPPPIVYLVGYGDYQFNGHPCLVSNFQYELPGDVDYIRANNPNNYGTNLLNRRNATVTSANPLASVASRLANAFLTPGALPPLPFEGIVPSSVTNTNRSTYVPTKMEITITLLPVQTRAQVSQNFSLKGFANGNLLKGGYW